MSDNAPSEGVHTHDLALNFIMDVQQLDETIDEILRQSWLCTSAYACLRATASADREAVLETWGNVADQLIIAVKALKASQRAFSINKAVFTDAIYKVDRGI